MSDQKTEILANKVLVVDDDEMLLNSLISMLEDYFKEIYRASSGQEAFQQAKALNPDLIVSDVNMPNGTGFELLEAILGEGLKIPVILVTGNTTYTEEFAKEKGANALIYKPFVSEKLIEVLREARIS